MGDSPNVMLVKFPAIYIVYNHVLFAKNMLILRFRVGSGDETRVCFDYCEKCCIIGAITVEPLYYGHPLDHIKCPD